MTISQLAALGAAVFAMTAAPAVSAASNDNPQKALNTARRIVRATDRAPIIETRDDSVVGGWPVYASYSDRSAQVAATYLRGRLVQGVVGAMSYAASDGCFTREAQPAFVGLGSLAASVLPLPSAQQRVSYALRGRTLRWVEPASKQHTAEQGTITFNARSRLITSRTDAFKDGRAKAGPQQITVSYPSRLPRFVPTSVPKPACKTKLKPNLRKSASKGGEKTLPHAS